MLLSHQRIGVLLSNHIKEYHVKNFITIIFVLFSFSTQASLLEESMRESSGNCLYNCVAMTKLANEWFVVAKGSEGEIKQIVSLQLPKTARLTSVSKVDNGNSFATQTRYSHNIETERYSYLANNQTVIVYLTIYRDSEGNVLQVITNIVRFDEIASRDDQ